ncbi:MAG: chloride channel protein [Myxococcota bacterium]|nr:chloride channel protein [Myxococcota bacterium]
MRVSIRRAHIHAFFPEATATSGAYALVTMSALVAATTHAPISAIIIIFELTQTIDIIPALMTACVISSLVCQSLSKGSIRERTGVQVLLLRRARKLANRAKEVVVPGADDVLGEGDTLVVAGKWESLEEFETPR